MRCIVNLIIVIAVLPMLSGCNRPAEIIAHRGASYLAPENTLASVKLAWQMGYDAEIDIHMSKDHRIMVIHDSTTKRTATVDLKVTDTTADKLRILDAGTFKSADYSGEPIPFLEDVIATIPPERKLYVEIKSSEKLLPLLKAIIADSGKKSQIVIIAFDLDTITAAKKLMPDIPMYWLKGTDKDKKTDTYIPHSPELVQTAIDHGLDGLDLHHAGVTEQFMDAVRAANQKLYVWTVDDPERARELTALGVAGITTNRPAWLAERLLQSN